MDSWSPNESWILDVEGQTYKRVTGFYRENHTKQTLEFVLSQKSKYAEKPRQKVSFDELLKFQKSVVDQSDPDMSEAQIVHCYQTAEAIRKAMPGEEYDWLHLVGLIHDCGKYLINYGEPQWAVVGDTYPVGCKRKHPPNMALPSFFDLNPESNDAQKSTEIGIYSPGCGLSNVHMSWGHDEFLYQVLTRNTHNLPEAALYIIRYHSFWYWHFGNQYEYLLDDTDRSMLKWLCLFRKFDLYSKVNDLPDAACVKPYYDQLLKKYFPQSYLEI
jgi:inositol oxygenase